MWVIAAWIRKSLAIVFILSGTTLLLIWWTSYENYGIVKKQSPVFVGSNEQFHTVGAVSVAESVVLKKQKESWYKIQSAEVTGWVPELVIEPLK